MYVYPLRFGRVELQKKKRIGIKFRFWRQRTCLVLSYCDLMISTTCETANLSHVRIVMLVTGMVSSRWGPNTGEYGILGMLSVGFKKLKKN